MTPSHTYQNNAALTATPKASRKLAEAEYIARLRLYRTPNVGPITFHQLIQRFGSALTALARLPDLALRGGSTAPIQVYSEAAALEELERHEKYGAQLLVFGDGLYPETLDSYPSVSPVLSALGDLQLLTQPKRLAIVGARNCSLVGQKMTRLLGTELAAKGYLIVSGLARGIDTVAHQTCLKTGTIAVIAGGIDQIYPADNKDLYRAIAEQGLILAESPFGTEPQATLFPKRNQVIAALSQGVIVVEAAVQSGSLITARYALEQHKDVFIVPGSPLDARYRGSHNLLKQGAHLITCGQDVLDVIERPYALNFREPETLPLEVPLEEDSHPPSSTLKEILLDSLSTEPILIEEVIRHCDVASSYVLRTILELELAGKVLRHTGNRISRLMDGQL